MARFKVKACDCERCDPMRFDEIASQASWSSIGATGTTLASFFPTYRNKTSKKGNKMSFKLVVKDGETEYKFDSKLGYNKAKNVDRVEEYETLTDALVEFLIVVQDNYDSDKVSLTFKRPKKDKK